MVQVEPDTGLLVTSTALLPARAPGPRMALIIDPADGYGAVHGPKPEPPQPALPAVTTSPAPPVARVTKAELEQISKSNQCDSCHSVTEARIGPPFTAISSRYAQKPRADTREVLAAKILYGGAGNWGAFPMIA